MLISKPNEWYFLLLRFNVSNYDSGESKTSVILRVDLNPLNRGTSVVECLRFLVCVL